MSGISRLLLAVNQLIITPLAALSLASLPAFGGGVSIKSYGHSALLIKGGGESVLLNPFRAVGCAAGLQEPRVSARVILASSELADEGARVANGQFLAQPGSYRIGRLKFEGLAADHDRLGGRRFGQTTLWHWEQGGLSFAHLGGAAVPLTRIQSLLLGRPDVLIIAVGGGAKVYTADEAADVVRELNPKLVIPVQFARRNPPKECDLTGLEPFLEAMKDSKVREVGNSVRLPGNLDDETVINVMR